MMDRADTLIELLSSPVLMERFVTAHGEEHPQMVAGCNSCVFRDEYLKQEAKHAAHEERHPDYVGACRECEQRRQHRVFARAERAKRNGVRR